MPGPDTGPIAPKKVEGPVAIWLDEWASMSPSPPAARQPVIDVAAVRKQTAVSEAVLLNERICLGAVHEGYREPPAPLVEVAGGTSVMPGMRHVAPGGETAYTARDIAGFLEICDKGGPAFLEMCGDRDAVARSHYHRGESWFVSCYAEVLRARGMTVWVMPGLGIAAKAKDE